MSGRTLLSLIITLVLGITASSAQHVNASEWWADGNLEDWRSFADRAMSVIDRAAASDGALESLRLQLVERQHSAQRAIAPLETRLTRLTARLEALGEEIDGEDEVATASQMLRAALAGEMARITPQLAILNDVMIEADGLLDDLDRLRQERSRSRFAQRQSSPLAPDIWQASRLYVADHVRRTLAETRSAISNDVQRTIVLDQLPFTAGLLIAGLSLIMFAQRLATLIGQRLRSLKGHAEPCILHIETFFAGMLIPVIGIAVIALAARISGLVGANGHAILDALPVASALYLVTVWLCGTLFGRSRHALLAPPPDGYRMRLPVAFHLIGGALALHAVIDSIAIAGGASVAVLSGLVYPIQILGSIGLFIAARAVLDQARASLADERVPQAYGRIVTLAALTAMGVAVIGPILSSVGYADLADQVVMASVATFVLCTLSFAVQRLSTQLLMPLLEAGQPIPMLRVGLLPFVIGTLILFVSVQVLFLIWGASLGELGQLWIRLSHGIEVGQERIGILRLLAAIALFIALLLLVRLAQALLRHSLLPNTELDAGAQQALVTGAGYLGLSIAALVGVTTLGLDLTNLAIVAGALSVGIGFGMQTIVSNFVSGIILLIERPINEGDWIEAGGVSGTVKHISVRSTRIETFDRATVVVPNTDLMAGQVTNWTLGNSFGRLRVPVGVAYGTDPRQVETILIELASQHPALAKEPRPWVVFAEFGADSLNFELRGILTDVNQVVTARSDLNHAIAERFEQEGIAIPFAQRDLWIRNLDQLKSAMRDDTTEPASGSDDASDASRA